MNVDELDYDLPRERIAQHPVSPRDSSRLLVVDRGRGALDDRLFRDLPLLLRPGDCLVLNRTRVLPARFALKRASGGRISGLFLRETAVGEWEVMLTNAGRVGPNEPLAVERGRHTATIVGGGEAGRFLIRLTPPAPAEQVLSAVGRAPLPPYIKREAESSYAEDLRDRLDYQTAYARDAGAVAAPTAGLHFTADLLEKVRALGVELVFVTLHVGPGTFLPITTERLDDHAMHTEWYELPAETAARLNAAGTDRRRRIAVGTTAVRVMESCAGEDGQVSPRSGWTSLLIQPPYRFRATDVLITNFHLPRSTLLALVFAFAGRDLTMQAYREAIARQYRFYSFGDAMMIV